MSTVTRAATGPLHDAPAANLAPKEHGAYAILGIPILTSLWIAGPTAIGLCVAVASVAGFLAHEPLLVALGQRGGRAQRTTPAARRRLGLRLSVTIACGAVALVAGTPSVRIALLICAALAAVSFGIAIAGKHRTLGGQLAGVISLSAACLPILLAGAVSTSHTIEAWATWLIGFGATTLAVRGVIAAQKRQARAFPVVAIGGLSVLVAALTYGDFPLPIASAPMIAMSWFLILAPPPAKQLKRVGWSLVVGTLCSAVWMAFTFAGQSA